MIQSMTEICFYDTTTRFEEKGLTVFAEPDLNVARILGYTVAPSPAVPTCRPDKSTSPLRRIFSNRMPSVSIEELQVNTRIAELRRPQPRSAGASNRPTRSQDVSELVRFFQTREDPLYAADKLDSAMDLVKAGRRLLSLSQARADKRAKQTASPTPSEKPSRGYRRLVALQQAVFLPPRASTEDVDSSRPLRAKRDVEAMGRPWLDDSVGTKNSSNNNSSGNQEQQETRQRCESLSLGDLAALLEFSVSFPDFEDGIGPPPYQVHQSQTGLQSSVPADGDQQGQDNDDDQRRLHSPVPTAADSARVRGGEAPKGARPALKSPGRTPQERSGPPVTLQSNTVDPKPSDDSRVVNSDRDDAKNLAVLQRATELLECEKKDAEQPSRDDNNNVETKATPTHSPNKGVTDTPLVVEPVHSAAPSRDDGDNRNGQPKVSGIRRDITPLTLARNPNGGPIPLTLVAECLPPRVSSRSACCQPQSSPQSMLDSASRPPRSLQTPTLDSFPRPQQTLLSPFPIQSRRARSVTPDGAPGQTAVRPKKRKKQQQQPQQPPSYYGVADVAPLPASTKPLPSLPQSTTSRDQESSSRRSTGDTESAMSSSSEQAGTMTVPGKPAEQVDSPTLGSMGRLKIRKHLTPRPSSRSTSKSFDMSETMPSSREDRHIKSTSSADSCLEQALRDRAEKVHALRMRDLSASKDRRCSGSSTRSLRNGTSSKKDDEDTGARPAEADAADRKIKRTEKRVSAAPSIPLPADPPVTAHRRRTGSSSSSLPWSVAALRGYEGDAVSRSNSVRSTSVTESSIHSGGNAHAATNGNTNGYYHRRSESASLPSSDEGANRSRRSSPSYANEEQNRERRRSGDHRPRSQKQQQQQPRPPEAGMNHFTEAQQHPRAGDHVVSHAQRERGPSSQEHSSPKSQYSQRTAYSQESRTSLRSSGQYLHPLEARVAQLERQNKMLQAALLAALDVGVTYDAECARNGLPSPLLSYSARLSSSLGGLAFDETRYEGERVNRKSYPARSSDSWASVRDQHSRGSQGSIDSNSSESDASVRAVENMLSDLDVSEASGEWNEEWNRHSQRSESGTT